MLVMKYGCKITKKKLNITMKSHKMDYFRAWDCLPTIVIHF